MAEFPRVFVIAALAAVITTAAVATSTPILADSIAIMNKGTMSLRDMLMRDFHLDLAITGGFGGSFDDPIIVTEGDPLRAATTEMLVLRCIGKGRGVLWRTLARAPMERDGIWREQVMLETKEIRLTEIVTQRENYYFDVVAADPGHQGLPAAPGFIDPKSGLKLAYEIGWLHLDGVTENEPVAAGFGYSLAYGAPGIKATVFVYDKGLAHIPDDVDDEIPKTEFRSAISDLVKMHPEYRPITPIASNGWMIRQDFRVADEQSVVALAVSARRFVKIRLTATANQNILQAAEEPLNAFMRELKGKPISKPNL